MRTKYILETLQEFKNAAATERVPEDTMPILTGRLEVCKPSHIGSGDHRVVLLNDDNYEMTMSFKDFVIQLAVLAEIPLFAQGVIPK